MSSSMTSCGHALMQSSHPLQYVSLTSIQPFAGIVSPYLGNINRKVPYGGSNQITSILIMSFYGLKV
jgi:hypothetical protein